MPAFVPGLDLNRRFYWEVVRPLLETCYPALPHAAALLGPGSETPGFDTEISMDHDWGARMFLFLREEDAYKAGDIAELLSYHLTLIFSGVQVHLPVNPNEPRTRQQITDPDVKQIASKQLNGNVDLWSDNTDIEGLERVKLCYLYE